MLKKILLISLVAIILIAAWYFLIYKPGHPILIEGAPCKTNNLPGKIIAGVCVSNAVIEDSIPKKK
jgi:hypothetical protein